jgi:hypothetical protein
VNTSRTLVLLCLALCAFPFAVCTPAQNNASQIAGGRHQFQLPKLAGADASSAAGTPRSPRAEGVRADSDPSCIYSFTDGSPASADYMNYCVTINGTFANFASPANAEMLNQGSPNEGFGVCDGNTNTAYWNYNNDFTVNWNPPVTVTSNATEVKIEQSTVDGNFLLTQIITKLPGPPPSAKIVMMLKNTSGVYRQAILLRYAEFVPNAASTSNNFQENHDSTRDAAWGYIPYYPTYSTQSGPFGLMMQNFGDPTPAFTFVERTGYDYNGNTGPDPCSPLAYDIDGNLLGQPGIIINGVGSEEYVYFLQLDKNQTSTVTLRYMPF